MLQIGVLRPRFSLCGQVMGLHLHHPFSQPGQQVAFLARLGQQLVTLTFVLPLFRTPPARMIRHRSSDAADTRHISSIENDHSNRPRCSQHIWYTTSSLCFPESTSRRLSPSASRRFFMGLVNFQGLVFIALKVYIVNHGSKLAPAHIGTLD